MVRYTPARPEDPMIERIRNVAIIAHVDHGKTTLVDKLLAASGTLDRKNIQNNLLYSYSHDVAKQNYNYIFVLIYEYILLPNDSPTLESDG